MKRNRIVSMFLVALLFVANLPIGQYVVEAATQEWKVDLDSCIVNETDFEGTSVGKFYGSTYSDPQIKLVGKPEYLSYSEENGSTKAVSTSGRDIAWTMVEDESYQRDGKTYTLGGPAIKFGNGYKKATDTSLSTMKIIVPMGDEIKAKKTATVSFEYRSPSWVELRMFYIAPGGTKKTSTTVKCNPTTWQTLTVEIDTSVGFMNYSGDDLKYKNECGFYLESLAVGPYYIRNIKVKAAGEAYAEIIPDPTKGSISGKASYDDGKIALQERMIYFDSVDNRWESDGDGGDTLYGYNKVGDTDVVYLARCYRNAVGGTQTYSGTRIGIDLSAEEFLLSHKQLVVELEYYDGEQSGQFNILYNKKGETKPSNKIWEENRKVARDGKWRRVAAVLPEEAVINENGDTAIDIGIGLYEMNHSLNIRAIRVMTQKYYDDLEKERQEASVNQENQWKYSSISFGDNVADDTVIGGISLYASDCIVEETTPTSENKNCSFETDINSDGCMRRAIVGGRDCVQLVNYYRIPNASVVNGNLYFALSDKFTTQDKDLYLEIEYFDEGTGSFNIRYKNADETSASNTVSVQCTDTKKWISKKIHIKDACFNGENSTGLGDGKCDFRIEKGSELEKLSIRRIAVYDDFNAETGRSFQTLNIGGANTERPYFTMGMWTSDCKNIILIADGVIYRYNIETEKLTELVQVYKNNYTVVNNNVYYYDYFTKTIRRINVDTLKDELITGLYETEEFTAVGDPLNINVNDDETKMNFMIKEEAEDSEEDKENLTETTGERVYRRIPIYNLTDGTWDLSHRFHKFDENEPYSGHMFINPKYDNLVFFAHEGESKDVPDRMWVMDLDTNEEINIFPQQHNAEGSANSVYTAEACGHESWVADGEHMVFVKYTNDTNLGTQGIMRVDKYGENYEYINNDYRYWHCHGSPDNRFVVADTIIGYEKSSIVLVDIKNGTSQKVCHIPATNDNDGQPHPAFSPDGKMVTFTYLDDNGVWNVGIMDVTDITTPENSEVIAKAISEDYGFAVSEPIQKDGAGSIYVKGLRSGFDVNLFGATFAEDNRMTGADMDRLTSKLGEENRIDLDGNKFFIWDNDNKPITYAPTAPERLRVIKNNGSLVQLVWGRPLNLLSDGATYEVYRDGELCGQVTDPYFCDSNVSENTDYIYAVRAVYPSGTKSPIAELKVHTGKGDGYILMAGDDIAAQGLDLIYNPDSDNDYYTESVEIGGIACRKATRNLLAGKSSDFRFNVKSSSINIGDNKIKFTVKYYDTGSRQITLKYRNTSGVYKEANLVKMSNSKTWKTATLEVSDAEFANNDMYAHKDCDFIVSAGLWSDLYLNEVSVQNIAIASQNAQRAYWSNNSSDGLDVVSTSGDTSYFVVSDNYIFGAEKCGVTITFDYVDNGTGDVVLVYDTSDKAFSNGKTVTVTKKTGTDTIKRARVFLVDTCFKNRLGSGADFMIQSDGSINNVNVVKGYIN